MKEKDDLIKLWIGKAENDLINAEHSINIKPNAPLDTVCFHAQQCAEKMAQVPAPVNDGGWVKYPDNPVLAGVSKSH